LLLHLRPGRGAFSTSTSLVTKNQRWSLPSPDYYFSCDYDSTQANCAISRAISPIRRY